MRILIINILLFISFSNMFGQNSCDTLPFLNCDRNEIIITDSINIHPFIEKLKNIKSEATEPIQIVHIGDSHLQAGFFTEKIKQELFQFNNSDTIGSPGFIFPYTIAKTNNPFFYKVDYTGSWDWCKNVDSEKTCSLGLSGITVRTKDSLAQIQIKMLNEKHDDQVKYHFNKVKILHSLGGTNVSVNGINANTNDGISTIFFENLTDSISIKIINNPSKEEYFELYGLILENTNTKLNYHTIGVNGATTQSYLKCDYFSSHLEEINPDLIIISLGTNEAFDKDFKVLEHEYILRDLILQIKDINPYSSILFTTANDHFKNGNPNKNVQAVRENIIKICNEFGLSCWDFYSIMGGEGSIENWYKKDITGNDKIHFKKKGYEVQGELFVQALIKLIEN